MMVSRLLRAQVAACALLLACSSSDGEPANDLSSTAGGGGSTAAGSGGIGGAGAPAGNGGQGPSAGDGGAAGTGASGTQGGGSAGASGTGGGGNAGTGGSAGFTGGPCEFNECGPACGHHAREVRGSGFAPSDEGKTAEFFVFSKATKSYVDAGHTTIAGGSTFLVIVFQSSDGFSCGSDVDLLVVVDRDGSGGCTAGDLVGTVHLSVGFPGHELTFSIDSASPAECSSLGP